MRALVLLLRVSLYRLPAVKPAWQGNAYVHQGWCCTCASGMDLPIAKAGGAAAGFARALDQALYMALVGHMLLRMWSKLSWVLALGQAQERLSPSTEQRWLSANRRRHAMMRRAVVHSHWHRYCHLTCGLSSGMDPEAFVFPVRCAAHRWAQSPRCAQHRVVNGRTSLRAGLLRGAKQAARMHGRQMQTLLMSCRYGAEVNLF